MKIGRDPRITNRTHVSDSATLWGTLYQLTQLKYEPWFFIFKAGHVSVRALDPGKVPGTRGPGHLSDAVVEARIGIAGRAHAHVASLKEKNHGSYLS